MQKSNILLDLFINHLSYSEILNFVAIKALVISFHNVLSTSDFEKR